MSIRMRHTSSHTRNRRAHHALAAPAVSKCEKCGKDKFPHRVCGNCGYYKGREVVNTLKSQKSKVKSQNYNAKSKNKNS